MDIAGFVRSSVVSSTIWIHSDWSGGTSESGDADERAPPDCATSALTILVSPVFERFAKQLAPPSNAFVLCVLLILLAIGTSLETFVEHLDDGISSCGFGGDGHSFGK